MQRLLSSFLRPASLHFGAYVRTGGGELSREKATVIREAAATSIPAVRSRRLRGRGLEGAEGAEVGGGVEGASGVRALAEEGREEVEARCECARRRMHLGAGTLGVAGSGSRERSEATRCQRPRARASPGGTLVSGQAMVSNGSGSRSGSRRKLSTSWSSSKWQPTCRRRSRSATERRERATSYDASRVS